uniref:NADH-ubiquinone oxidoreductase chain 1 n=1 Tax=Gnathostomula paradoxa TaxID=66783 RepID=A0A0F6PZ90_9BILA|nr:NADH dehydrogenase subunit 1 [Gnathostomula paradoxa]AKD00031.1 NADH dehydrogenase subunit 1 [Gnathostomula paradoxa]
MFKSFFINNTLVVVIVLLCVAFYTLLERKILSYSQIRKGPNKMSLLGFLQPLIDGLKLFLKNFFILFYTNSSFFIILPATIFFINVSIWAFYTLTFNFNYNYLALLFLMFLFSLDVYKLFFTSFSSTNKYATMGNFRMINQFISYEIIFAFILFLWFSIFCSFSLVVKYFFSNYFTLFLFSMILWIIFILMESNRTPFDLSEGESELVSGFNTEFSSISFTFLFLAEYSKILFLCLMAAFLFTNNFIITITIFILYAMIFLLTRSAYPRIRYDKIMHFTWTVMLPIVNICLLTSFFYLMLW